VVAVFEVATAVTVPVNVPRAPTNWPVPPVMLPVSVLLAVVALVNSPGPVNDANSLLPLTNRKVLLPVTVNVVAVGLVRVNVSVSWSVAVPSGEK